MGNGIDAKTATISTLEMTRMNDTEAMISCGIVGLFDWTALLITYSGTTPSVTDDHGVLNGTFTIASTDIRRLSDTTAIAVIGEAVNTDARAVVITNTSGTLSNGTIVTFDTETAEYSSIALPDFDHAVVTIGHSETAMRTTVLEIDGATLTALTTRTKSVDREYISSCEVGTNFVLVGYEDDDNTSSGRAQVLTV